MLEMVNDGYTIYSDVGMAGAERGGRGQSVIKGKRLYLYPCFLIDLKKNQPCSAKDMLKIFFL